MSLTRQDLAAIDQLIEKRLNIALKQNNAELRMDWRNDIQKSQDETISRLMSVLVHFPTRDEVKQMIEESSTILAIKSDINALKDYLTEFREDFEIRDTFTQGRISRLESAFGGGQANYLASPNKPTQR